MGGNGSFISGITNFEDGRTYKTILSIGDNIKILEILIAIIPVLDPEIATRINVVINNA